MELLDFLRLLFVEVPIALYQVIVCGNKEFSVKHIVLYLFRIHPILTIASCLLLFCALGAVQDHYRQKHSDSRALAYVQRFTDNVYVFGDKIFHYAEKNEARLQNPSKVVLLYEKYLSNQTYWERQDHKHELNMRIINARNSTAQCEHMEE